MWCWARGSTHSPTGILIRTCASSRSISSDAGVEAHDLPTAEIDSHESHLCGSSIWSTRRLRQGPDGGGHGDGRRRRSSLRSAWCRTYRWLLFDPRLRRLRRFPRRLRGSRLTSVFPRSAGAASRREIFERLAGHGWLPGRALPAFLHVGPELEAELRSGGFSPIELIGPEGLNRLIFRNRTDGLKLSSSASRCLRRRG